MKKYCLALLLCLFLFLIFPSVNLYSGNDHLPVGSRQAGMGRTSVTLTDFWSCQNNQAGIALIDKINAGIYYESRFSLSELSSKSIGVVVPTGIGVLGVTFNHFGYELYSDIKIGLVYARSFSPYFRFGLQLDYLLTTFGDNYGNKSNITFELGIQSDITESLTIGVWVFNPVQVKFTDYNNEKIPAVFRFGLKWQAAKSLYVCIEAEKNTYMKPLIISGGIEYGLNEKFFFRSGFSTGQEVFSMGFGFRMRFLRFDISAVMHESMGFTPQASLIFQF